MRRCGNCGSKELKRTSQKGRPFPWRDYPAVYLTSKFEALECQLCHNLVLSAADNELLDEVILESINQTTKMLIEKIIKDKGCTQQEIAEHLGVTKEYLSEIKSGRKQPSFQVFNFLKTIALAPEAFSVSNPSRDVNKLMSA